MLKTVVFYIITLVLFALARLTGFGQDKILYGPDRTAVFAFSEAITDNLFAGLAANDYEMFSRDFDKDMQKTIPATEFAAWKQSLDGYLGNYISRQVDQVTQSDEFYVVVYQATFEQAEPVTVGVAFHAVKPHAISHLWFDSEAIQLELH